MLIAPQIQRDGVNDLEGWDGDGDDDAAGDYGEGGGGAEGEGLVGGEESGEEGFDTGAVAGVGVDGGEGGGEGVGGVRAEVEFVEEGGRFEEEGGREVEAGEEGREEEVCVFCEAGGGERLFEEGRDGVADLWGEGQQGQPKTKGRHVCYLRQCWCTRL